MARLLPDWIDSYLEYTDNTEPAKNFRLWVAISTIASMLKRKCILDLGMMKTFPNMYIILVGPPAARKGTAMSPGIDFLYKAEIPMSADSTTKEALIRAIIDSYRNEPVEDGDPIHHCSYTICSPEFSVLIGHGDMQMLKYLTDWFDCGKGPEGRWDYHTKGTGHEVITGIWVNLIGATTPEQIGMHPEIVGVGLGSRIVFVYEENKAKSVAFPFLSDKQKEIREKLYHDVEQIQLLQGKFKSTKNWIDMYQKWYDDSDLNPPFKDRRLSKYCGRRAVHLQKLCMILSASRSDELILRGQDMVRAVKILTRTEAKMPGAFGAMGDDPTVSLLNAMMKEIITIKEISYSELLSHHYFDAAGHGVFDGVLTTLESMKMITINKKKTDTGFERIIKKV